MSFVVPTFRRPGVLRATLDALVHLDYPQDLYEVIVVDDGSADSTPDVIEQFSAVKSPIICVMQENSGVARARNVGAARASGELLIFLDDDILVESDHVERHLATHQRYGECLVNGHWEFPCGMRRTLESTPFGRFRVEIEDWLRREIHKQKPRADGTLRLSGVTGCNLSISAELFRKLGGFDESFPFAGYEDQEFAHRAQRAGCIFIYDPAIRLLHNDERVTLEQFCARQRRGALTSVFLVARHPEEFADRRLLVDNAPITRYDPPRMVVKKVVKSLASTRVARAIADGARRMLEYIAPESAVLRRLYTAIVGVHIFRGVREGLQRLPEARASVVAATRARYARA